MQIYQNSIFKKIPVQVRGQSLFYHWYLQNYWNFEFFASKRKQMKKKEIRKEG